MLTEGNTWTGDWFQPETMKYFNLNKVNEQNLLLKLGDINLIESRQLS